MPSVDPTKLKAFRKEFDDLIGRAVVDGLLSPWETPQAPGVGIHAEGGNYLQDGGDYNQSTGGEHEQTGGGGYTQSIPKTEAG